MSSIVVFIFGASNVIYIVDTTLLKAKSEPSIRDVDQLNSVDGETYQSILPQPSEWQFGLIKRLC